LFFVLEKKEKEMIVEVTEKQIQEVFIPIFALAEQHNVNKDLSVHFIVNRALNILTTEIKDKKKKK